MGKIIVFVVVSLVAIGSLGWALGDHQRRVDVPDSEAHFPTAGVSSTRTRIEPNMLVGWMERGDSTCLVIDLRSSEAYQQRHLWRAINREFDQLIGLQSLRRLPRHRAIVVYGDDSEKAAAAAEVLRMTGLNAYYLPLDQASWSVLPIADASGGGARIVNARNTSPAVGHQGGHGRGSDRTAVEMRGVTATSDVPAKGAAPAELASLGFLDSGPQGIVASAAMGPAGD